jgi:hypothetical protein
VMKYADHKIDIGAERLGTYHPLTGIA